MQPVSPGPLETTAETSEESGRDVGRPRHWPTRQRQGQGVKNASPMDSSAGTGKFSKKYAVFF